ncbi:MAG: MBL fold metallo-hydrolase [Actinomycetota bacterium]
MVEAETHGIPCAFFFPDATPEDVGVIDWLEPSQIGANGTIGMTVQSFLLELPGLVVLVDPCVGNHKRRTDFAFWNDLDLPWLDRLAEAGHRPADVGLVVHTHLHEDHVGWDTHLVDGEWVPTFPNARHVYVGDELDFWRAEHERDGREAWADSVQPILDAGLADVVAADADLGHGIRLVSTPGHTPGHVSVEVDAGAEALSITGDLTHHPLQLARPDLREVADADAELARRTRSEYFAHHAREGTMLAATHYPGSALGRIEAAGPAWRWVAEPGVDPATG